MARNRSYVWLSVSLPSSGSRIVVPSSKYVLLLGLKKQYIFAKRDNDQGKMSGCVEVDGRMVCVAEVLVVIMAALCNRGTIIFLPVISFYLSIYLSIYLSFFFYSSPNLSGRRLDVYHTLTHGVALVRI